MNEIDVGTLATNDLLQLALVALRDGDEKRAVEVFEALVENLKDDAPLPDVKLTDTYWDGVLWFIPGNPDRFDDETD